jgi:hypothetical protein
VNLAYFFAGAREQPGKEIFDVFFGQRCHGLATDICVCYPIRVPNASNATLNVLGLIVTISRVGETQELSCSPCTLAPEWLLAFGSSGFPVNNLSMVSSTVLSSRVGCGKVRTYVIG